MAPIIPDSTAFHPGYLLNAAPVRPTRGEVSISVEALYKQAAAAQRAGRPDEAEALYTAATLAADVADRASIRPQEKGELTP